MEFEQLQLRDSSLAAFPFQLLPGVVHSPDSHQKLLTWQAAEAAYTGALPKFSFVLFSSGVEEGIDLTLTSLALQSLPASDIILVGDAAAEVPKGAGAAVSAAKRPAGYRAVPRASAQSELQSVRSEWVVCAFSNVILHPQALFILGKEVVQRNPAAAFFNELRVDPARLTPREFVRRSAFQPVMIFHPDAAGTLVAMRVDVFRKWLDGEAPIHLAAEAAISVAANHGDIAHVPLALYSSLLPVKCNLPEPDTLEYCARQWGIAVEHIQRPGFPGGTVLPPIAPGDVQVIIPFKNRPELTSQCIESLATLALSERIFLTLVDNGSDAESANAVERRATELFPERSEVVHVDGPFNFARLNNRGAQTRSTEHLLLLNNDVLFSEPESLAEMLRWMSVRSVGVVGAVLRYPTGTIQTAGIYFAPVRPANLADERQYLSAVRPVNGVSYACSLFRRSVFDAIGGLDERRCPNGFGDALCAQLVRDKGWVHVVTPYARAVHHESPSRGSVPEDLELWELVSGGVPIADLYPDMGIRDHIERVPLAGQASPRLRAAARRLWGSRPARKLRMLLK